MVQKTRKQRQDAKKTEARKAEAKKPFMSERQKQVFLVVLAMMVVLVPLVHTLRCRAECVKRKQTPYPEIACKYDCPWFWAKKR